MKTLVITRRINMPEKKPKKTGGRGRPATGHTNFITVNMLAEVRELARRYLIRHELDTGERIAMSQYVSDAVMDKLQRDRAEA